MNVNKEGRKINKDICLWIKEEIQSDVSNK